MRLLPVALRYRRNVLFPPKCSFIFDLKGRHVFTFRQTAQFTKNLTISDEYVSVSPTNNHRLRHIFSAKFCLHAQLIKNQENRKHRL